MAVLKAGTTVGGKAVLTQDDTAAAAQKLAAARTISLTGDVTGSTTFDGTANRSISAALASSGVTAGTYGPDVVGENAASWCATNIGVHSSTAQTKFTLTKAGTVFFSYRVDSESTYDKLTVTVTAGGTASTPVNAVSGRNQTGTVTNAALAVGDTLLFQFVKDGSVSTGDDTATIFNLQFKETDKSAVTITQKNMSSYFTVAHSSPYYFGAVSAVGPVVPVPKITVDAKGRITSANNSYVPIKSPQVTGIYHAGTSAPSDKSLLWIDTTAGTGGLKYYNGSAWVLVPVGYQA